MKKNVAGLMPTGILISASALFSLGFVSVFQGTASAAKVTLRVAHAWPSVRLERQLEFDKKFMERHPNIQIKCENIDWGTFRDKLLTRFASGTAPDIMYTLGGWAQIWINKGLFKDLTPFIRQEKNFNIQDFSVEGLRKYRKQNRYYALPYAWSPMPIYYNENLLRMAGVQYPDYNSFDIAKLLEISKKLTKDANNDGRPEQIGFEMNFGGGWMVDTLLRPFGARFLSNDEQTITVNDPKGIQAIQWWADMILKQKVAQAGWSFVNGKVALAYGMGSWDIGYAQQNIKNKFGWNINHFPKGPAGRCVVAESSGYGITAASKHPKEAWQYLTEYLSTEGQIFMRESFGIDVSRKSARTLDFPGMPKDLDVKVIFEMLDNYAVDAPMNPAADYVWPVVSREYGNILASKKSVPQALEAIAKEGNTILKTRKLK